jgi:hypothetical protein
MEQKKGAYGYFMDLGDKMEVVSIFLAKEREAEVKESDVLFGMTLGATAEALRTNITASAHAPCELVASACTNYHPFFSSF